MSPIQWFQIWKAQASVVAQSLEGEPSVSVEIRRLHLDHQDVVTLARPGYSRTFRRYIESGHIGFGAFREAQLVALGWIYPNSQEASCRVGYYPLPAKTAWLHADWTHPKARGANLHRALIVARARWLASRYAGWMLEANILKKNSVSVHNYRKSGFERAGTVYRLNFWRIGASWRTHV